MNNKIILVGALLCLLVSGCQEISVSIELPEQVLQITPSPDPTVRSSDDSVSVGEQQDDFTVSQEETIEPVSQAFDPYEYYFADDVLPEDIVFYSDNKKTLLVSYLESPGSLLGIAHVREYFSYDNDLFIAQDIIQCPIDVQSIMLHSGHNGDQYFPTEEEYALGEESVIYHGDNGISYRFYKNNMMVVVDVRGSHPWATEENAYQLAKMIYEKLPESFPIPDLIESPSMDYRSELSGKSFKYIEFVECHPPHGLTNPVIQTELGYCFKTEVMDIIYNLKVGIYDKRYDKLVYMKEFLFVPQMGEWISGMFYPVWGYGWQHFHEGDYEAYFWVNDQLVEVIPYSLIIENQ